MKRCKTALLSATILTSATLMTAIPVLAQNFTEIGTPLGRIVLGVGGDGNVAIDTPQAVTVITEEEIDRENATTLGELFNVVPGVQVTGSERIAGESFNIRGIGSLDQSSESRIIVNVDGATKFYEQYRLGSFFGDPALFRRVEVLRGPASSTLYGSGALGGVVVVETKDASDFLINTDTAIQTRLSYGSNNDEIKSSVIFASRPTDNFETLVSLSYRQAGDYTTGDGSVVASEFDAISGLLKSRLTFGDDNAQALKFSYSRGESDLDDTQLSQTNSSAFFGTVDRNLVDQTSAIRYENPMLGNNLIDLDVVLSYSDTQNVQSDPSLGFLCAIGNFEVLCPSEYGYETANLKVENVSEITGKNYVAYITAGVQLSYQERSAQNSLGTPSFHPEGTDEKIGIYVQGEFIFNENLTLIPGLRVDKVNLTPADGTTFAESSETSFSPKLALHYGIDDTFSVFGSVSRTERAPTLDELFSSDADEPNTPNLVSETATSVELGLSASYAGLLTSDDLLDFKVTTFYSEIDGLISRDSTAATPFYNQVDASKIYGAEVEVAYQSDTMFVRAAYSDVRGEDLATGVILSSIPARSLNLTIGGQNQDLGLRYGWQGNLVDGIEYAATEHSGYAVHDLFVDWSPQQGAIEGFNVGFRVNNVLDRKYQNSLAGDAGKGKSYEISLTRGFEF